MKHSLFTLIGLLGFLGSPLAAQSNIEEVASFADMADRANTFTGGDLSGLLIVLDDDDTLTQVPCSNPAERDACQYLGGPAWVTWQIGLIKNGGTDPYRVADGFADLFAIEAMLFAMMDMVYTDPGIPAALSHLINPVTGPTGARLIVLTARGGVDISATQAQFSNLKAGNGGQPLSEYVAENALLGAQSGLPSLASPFLLDTPPECHAKRRYSYTRGAMFTAGQGKGQALKCLLALTDGADISHIVFMDDTLANVQDVAAAFRPGSAPALLPLHYTRLRAHKAALTSGPNAQGYQAIALERWEALRAALEAQLVSPISALD